MSNQQGELKQEENEKRNLLKKEKPYVYEKIMKYDEKVKKGESIAILNFQYDYKCNFRCEHCCIDKLKNNKEDRFFTLDDVKELSRQADEMGLAQFIITGGESTMFPDLDDLIKAIDPPKFYIALESNGWFIDERKTRHLKSIGIDKILMSLDSLSATEHDNFRRKKGSHEKVLRAIDAALKAGLPVTILTVVTKQRVRSKEFIDFIEFINGKGAGVFVTYAKPVGAWEGNFDALVDREDMDYVRELEKKYDLFTHLTSSYDLNLGCLAVKRIVSFTKYGDVMPCPYIHVSLGNFFKEPLKDIIQRGMKIKYFGEYVDTCLIAEDRKFINDYMVKKTYGKPKPVPCSEVFTREDYIN